MVGITSYGVYIPWNRLNRRAVFSAIGWLNMSAGAWARGEKAVASYDEDSLSLAVNAARSCLEGQERNSVDGLYLASTTFPYAERQNSSVAATALGLRENLRTADFTGSLKAGTTALLAASEKVGQEGGRVLVAAADCRLGKAGSVQEQIFGDAGAALLIGDKGVLATLEGSYSVALDFADHRRLAGEVFDRAWEERWIRDQGYAKHIPAAIKALLEKYHLKIGDFAKIIFPCPYENVRSSIARKIGATPEQIQDSLVYTIGETGTPHPLLMLATALEEAQPQDRILLVGYGNGYDALILQVTDGINGFRARRRLHGVPYYLNRKRELASYEKYVSFQRVLPIETGIRGEEIAATSLSALWRDRKVVLGLEGSRCRRCGTPQYPAQRICVNPDCGAVDEMEPYSFAERTGRVFTYTADYLAFSPDPPAIYAIIDFDGGGRFWFDVADCSLPDVRVGLPVMMTFRRKYLDQARGVSGYFWKATPLSAGGGAGNA